MVKVVACHARDRGSNQVGFNVFFPLGSLHWWQRWDSGTPEEAGSGQEWAVFRVCRNG